MPAKLRAVFLKQSGELLEDERVGGHWGAAVKVAAKIANAHRKLDELHVSGLTVVIGAGNLARGNTLKAQGLADKYADAIGRWGTIGNAMVLVGALEAAKVPVEALITANMQYQDPKFSFDSYSPQKVLAAHRRGKIVVIAGGTGEDNVTTDNAVAFYAKDFRKVFDGEIAVLKGTKYDGVYDKDPAKNKDAKKYPTISAQFMRDNYEQFKVVDKRSLDQLIDGDLSMLIYSEPLHPLEKVLALKDYQIGTLVTPD